MPDSFDRKIMAVLQSDPSITIGTLADQVGLSQTPCWRRVKQLEKDGYISHRAVILDPRKLGYMVNVFACVRVSRHDEDTLDALEAEVLRHPQIVECFSLSGDADYVMRIIARSIEDYEAFLKKVILHLPGVSSVNSSFALRSIKLTTEIPV